MEQHDPGTSHAARPMRPGATRTILIVDADRAALTMLGQQIGRLGYFVVLAESGIEALDLIAGRGFDLVLIAADMPGLGGTQVLAEIRSNRETTDLPVILIAAHADEGRAVQAFAAGADDHVVRPFALAELAARIARTLARAQRIAELKRSNAALDARVAARAIELGEARSALAAARADRSRLAGSLRQLHADVGRAPARVERRALSSFGA